MRLLTGQLAAPHARVELRVGPAALREAVAAVAEQDPDAVLRAAESSGGELHDVLGGRSGGSGATPIPALFHSLLQLALDTGTGRRQRVHVRPRVIYLAHAHGGDSRGS